RCIGGPRDTSIRCRAASTSLRLPETQKTEQCAQQGHACPRNEYRFVSETAGDEAAKQRADADAKKKHGVERTHQPATPRGSDVFGQHCHQRGPKAPTPD